MKSLGDAREEITGLAELNGLGSFELLEHRPEKTIVRSHKEVSSGVKAMSLRWSRLPGRPRPGGRFFREVGKRFMINRAAWAIDPVPTDV